MLKSVHLFFILMLPLVLCADAPDFLNREAKVGKASLARNAYIFSHLLDTANFSPELRLPLQLLYDSSSRQSGLFGFGWHCPQLESSAHYDKDGVLWTTPWGEKIKFYPKHAKPPKDAIKIRIIEDARKGRGFYCPYSDWEADTLERDYKRSGSWIFKGKGDMRGWKFIYRNFKLSVMIAPSGRQLEYVYKDRWPLYVMQDGRKFIEFAYAGNTVSALKINGTEHKLTYSSVQVKILPETVHGKMLNVSRPCLSAVQRGDLLPIKFSYDDYGFLNSIRQGEYVDNLVIQHQTLEERRAELTARQNSKDKYAGPVNGRILSDNQYDYSYHSTAAGAISMTNRKKQQAHYNYQAAIGTFKITDFSGKSHTVYYYMRHDVAYMGKVRKVVDSRGREVLSYRYDRISGKVVRIRDIAGNDINLEYGANGEVALITRRAADQDKAEPVQALQYDTAGNVTSMSILDAGGKAVVTNHLEYGKYRQLHSVSNGQMRHEIEYNDFGYPIRIGNIFNQVMHRELDEYNRLVNTTDFYGVKTYYTYTPAGLIAGIERRDGEKLLTSLTISYNGCGQPIRYTDHSGKVKLFERDAFGRVVKELFPDDTEVSYTYNELGQLHTVLDQNKHKITFDWNMFGLDAKTTPAGQLTDYVHDKYGMLTGMLSRQGSEMSRDLRYEYDQFDRIVKVDYGNGDVETRQYDSWGKIIATQRGKDKVVYKYDYHGRMIEKTGSFEKESRTFNAYGQRTHRITERGNVRLDEQRFYDGYGRLQKIVSGDKCVEFVYNEYNQIQRQIVNGVKIEFTYSKYGQLLSKRMINK